MDTWFHILKWYPHVRLRRVCKQFRDVIDMLARPMLAKLRPELTAFFRDNPVPHQYDRTGGKCKIRTYDYSGKHKAWNNGEYTHVLGFILAEIAQMDSFGAYAQFCHRYDLLICPCSRSQGDGTYSDFYGISRCKITSTSISGFTHTWRFTNKRLPELWNLTSRFTHHIVIVNK